MALAACTYERLASRIEECQPTPPGSQCLVEYWASDRSDEQGAEADGAEPGGGTSPDGPHCGGGTSLLRGRQVQDPDRRGVQPQSVQGGPAAGHRQLDRSRTC